MVDYIFSALRALRFCSLFVEDVSSEIPLFGFFLEVLTFFLEICQFFSNSLNAGLEIA